MNDYILETFIENKNNYEDLYQTLIDNKTDIINKLNDTTLML